MPRRSTNRAHFIKPALHKALQAGIPRTSAKSKIQFDMRLSSGRHCSQRMLSRKSCADKSVDICRALFRYGRIEEVFFVQDAITRRKRYRTKAAISEIKRQAKRWNHHQSMGLVRMGKRTLKWVSPGLVSNSISPRCRSATIRLLISKPRPVPDPTGLVV